MPFALPASNAVEDYIRGEANAVALDLVERWPEWPYSIVLVYGEAGSGKTHLAHVFARRAKATFVAPNRLGQQPADQLLTGNHAWVLDGLESVVDAPALAQLINHARARGDYLLITAEKSPSAMQIALPDLRSRLLALPCVMLDAPDDALLAGVIAKQFADRQLRISPEVLHYAVQHIERSYAAASRFVQMMDTLSLSSGRALTIPLVRKALHEAVGNNA